MHRRPSDWWAVGLEAAHGPEGGETGPNGARRHGRPCCTDTALSVVGGGCDSRFQVNRVDIGAKLWRCVNRLMRWRRNADKVR